MTPVRGSSFEKLLLRAHIADRRLADRPGWGRFSTGTVRLAAGFSAPYPTLSTARNTASECFGARKALRHVRQPSTCAFDGCSMTPVEGLSTCVESLVDNVKTACSYVVSTTASSVGRGFQRRPLPAVSLNGRRGDSVDEHVDDEPEGWCSEGLLR